MIRVKGIKNIKIKKYVDIDKRNQRIENWGPENELEVYGKLFGGRGKHEARTRTDVKLEILVWSCSDICLFHGEKFSYGANWER